MAVQYKIMIINDIFDSENLLVIKGGGVQIIQRHEEWITSEILHEALAENKIEINSCVINVVEEDRKGNPQISRWG
jgi:hypothetical protein